jgi:hypothetical protein
MQVQFAQDLKVFITRNIDIVDGTIIRTGLTKANTKQLLILSNSLSIAQEKKYSYVDNSTGLDSQIKLDTVAGSSVELGTLSFTTLINSSREGPFDVQLWNGLIAEPNYPNNLWTISSDFRSINPIRTADSVNKMGVIVVLKGVTYLIHDVRVLDASIEFDISGFAQTTWTLNYTSYTMLSSSTLTELSTEFILTNGLSGTAEKLDQTKYIFSSGKFLLVKFQDINNNTTLGTLATTTASLYIKNTLSYIEDTRLDSPVLSQLFSGSGGQLVEGSLAAYSRNTGSFSHTLISSLNSQVYEPQTARNYGILLTLMNSPTKKLLEVNLSPCVVTHSTEFSTAITDTFNYKLVQGLSNTDCYIKFYT